MSREGKLVKNTLILSIGTFLPKLAAFITLPILTAYLSKEQYGTYDLISILAGLILPVTTLQIHTAIFRFLLDVKGDREYAKLYFSNAIAFIIPISVVTLAVLYFVTPIEDPFIKIWTCVYLFFDTVVCEARQLTRGLFRNLDYSISAIISAAIKLLLAFLLVQLLEWELGGAIIALALSPVFSLLYLIFRIKLYQLIDFKLVSKKTIKEMLSYSWAMVPNNMSSWVMRVSDRFIVTGFLGLAQNAVYAVANKIPSLLTLAQTTFSLAWAENASVVSKDDDAGAYYSKMFSVMINLYGGTLGLIIACTPLLFLILIKGDYTEAYTQMPILFLSMFFYCLSSFLGGIYIAFKATKSVALTVFLAAICNVVIDLSLINFIGLYAASGSTLISYILLTVFRMINVRKIVPIKYDIKQIVLVFVILAIEVTLFYFNTIITNTVNVVFGIFFFCYLNKNLIKGIFSSVKKKLGKGKAK